MTFSAIDHLECCTCQKQYSPKKLINICDCGFPLTVKYDLEKAKGSTSPEEIRMRPGNIWRYHEILPVENEKNIITLGEGFSPLLHLKQLSTLLGFTQLYLKYEGGNVGGTFKARGASVGLSKAAELGAKKIAIATNGNAGEAWAMYAASGNIPIVVIMPVDAQEMTQIICSSMGATTYLMKGLISDAGKYIENHKAANGWFDVSTLKEPYRLEGKKTIALEIIEQFGWTFPDVMIFPTGGGISIAAAYKAFQELKTLGWVTGKLPRLIAVQAEGCAPLEKAYLSQSQSTDFFEGAKTMANGLRVPKPFCDFMVLEAIYKTEGSVISVSDEEMLEGVKLIGKTEGLFLCPEAGATIASLKKLKEKKLLDKDEKIVLLGSGSGLKYKDAFKKTDLEILNAPK